MADELKRGTLFSLKEYQSLRANRDAFVHFCDCFLKNVSGRMKWRSDLLQKPLTAVATESDEAFTLLVLENNWDYWLALAAEKSDGNGENDRIDNRRIRRNGWTVHPKWTGRASYCGKMDGWDDEAIDRYNDLIDLVVKDREVRGTVMDREYLSLMRRKQPRQYDRMERSLSRSGRRKRARVILPQAVGQRSFVPRTVHYEERSFVGVSSTLTGESQMASSIAAINHVDNLDAVNPFVPV